MRTVTQQVELEALKELASVANDYDIKFYLRGGSVMGAIKYDGFIPWDDDVDIAVPRSDYNKLIGVLSGDWSDKFWMASYLNGDEIHSYFPRILLKEDYRKKLGIQTNNLLGRTIIDVLPLDGVPSTKIGRFIYKYEVMVLRLLAALWTYNVRETVMIHSGKKQRIMKLLTSIGIHKMYTQNQVYAALDKIYSKVSFENATWAGTITGSAFDKELFPAEIFGDGVFHKFEDAEFRVPEKYDLYLKQIYGENYATFEPEFKKNHTESKRID